MLFNSLTFLLFFPAVILVYYLIPAKAPVWVRSLWLLIASYYFYMSWNAKYVVLLIFSTLVTYGVGLILGSESLQGKIVFRKIMFVAGILANLGILGLFKYFNFAANTINILASRFGVNFHVTGVNLLLPVGISFYTFQALGYMIDVYKNPKCVTRNLLYYALFVSFFPQLVAGPIERGENLLPQLRERHPFSYENLTAGLQIMLYGYFLKLVIADRAALFVDRIYGDSDNMSGFLLALASVLFVFQLYCDFYGYSVIAKGAARVLGISLMDNFKSPFITTSITELWRRWHVSLTGWFRDYLYISLGGNRKGVVRKYVNVMLVFLVSGLWHGANWTYVVWGALNGFYQVVEGSLKEATKWRSTGRGKKRDASGEKSWNGEKTRNGEKTWNGEKLWNGEKSWNDENTRPREAVPATGGNRSRSVTGILLAVPKGILTFALFAFAMIFFRAVSVSQGISIIKRIGTLHGFWELPILNAEEMTHVSFWDLGLTKGNFCVLVLAIMILLILDFVKARGISVRLWVGERTLPIRWTIYLGTLLIVLVFGIWGMGYHAANFIYFQF